MFQIPRVFQAVNMNSRVFFNHRADFIHQQNRTNLHLVEAKKTCDIAGAKEPSDDCVFPLNEQLRSCFFEPQNPQKSQGS